MRYTELLEKSGGDIIIGLAKKAYSSLSHDAKKAIDDWETMNWTSGSLVQHIKANDDIAQEIEKAFEPVRNALPPKITLYRGVRLESGHSEWQNAYLESWTSDRRVAELFAGLRVGDSLKSTLYDIKTDEEIAKAIDQYEKTGFLKFDNHYYVRNKEYPEYYDIYDKNKNYITDGDNLERDLTRDNEEKKKLNSEKLEGSKVFEEEIDRDRIVWITNSLGSKEYIVKK